MSEIIAVFMDAIYSEKLHAFVDKNKDFLNKALLLEKEIVSTNDWRCNTFSTLNTTYNLLDDSIFKELISACEEETRKFAEQYGVTKGKSKCFEAWINVAKPGAYQEYHVHPNSHFSLVYYVEAPKNCGNLVFTSNSQDMFPLPTQTLTQLSFKTYFITPQAANLHIFRSNLKHMVELNQSDSPRVSISMNLKIVD
jgi:uncharacterized protein (TIGR02466 family)